MNNGVSEDSVFTALFEDFFDDLLRISWKICGRFEVAQELCQEAFMRYYERRGKLPAGVEARYWLIRVVKNLALNYVKRQYREGRAYRSYGHQHPDAALNDGEVAALTDESREHVRLALLTVPYNLRVALVLREYAGYSYADIAQILRISESNVKVRIFRARKILSKTLLKGDVHVP